MNYTLWGISKTGTLSLGRGVPVEESDSRDYSFKASCKSIPSALATPVPYAGSAFVAVAHMTFV